jgi:hypothetical protein
VAVDSLVRFLTLSWARLGSDNHFFTINASSMVSHFGNDLSSLEFVHATIGTGSYRIPKVLGLLKDGLIAAEGLMAEGIFRVSGEEEQVQLARRSVDQGSWQEINDPHVMANLIKVLLNCKSVIENRDYKYICAQDLATRIATTYYSTIHGRVDDMHKREKFP